MSLLAAQLASAGLYGQALETAPSIKQAPHRDGALKSVSAKLAEAGLYERAERAAGLLANPNQRAEALSDLPKAFAAAGMYQSASQAAIEAELSAGRFPSVAVLANVATSVD